MIPHPDRSKAAKNPAEMDDHDLLVGIYRAAMTIRSIVLFWLVLSIIGGLLLLAAASSTT